MHSWSRSLLLAAMFLSTASAAPAFADDSASSDSSGTVYVVSTAHLDTQWRWTIQQTINEYIPATLHQNFALFEQFPDYIFSFEGAFRYMLAKEYFPEDYARLKQYINLGRWQVCGSWVDAVDVNVPSPESLIRHTLYGNGFFKREFGVSSVDVYLPDCFGFGYALPTIAKHCGLNGFSTQKLSWGCWVGTPFDIGRWRGVDGSELIAAVNPGSYTSELRGDLSADSSWQAHAARQDSASGLAIGYKYIGVGDTGGAPDSTTVAWLETAIQHPSGPLAIRNTGADQLYRDLTPGEVQQLPLYDGELVMTRHGVGCYTSEATMKRWNRQNEQLAQAAERAASLAARFGGYDYPRDELREAWTRFLWHQFHDDLTGTSIPEAYPFSWNDELLSLNQFAEILQDAAGAIIARMNTETRGIPVVVYNPATIGGVRTAEAILDFHGAVPEYLAAESPEGRSGPVQILSEDGDKARIAFDVNVPPIGFAVYDVYGVAHPVESNISDLKPFASEHELLGRNMDVRVDKNGDITAIEDLAGDGGNELSAPIRLAIYDDEPRNWAAWEIDYDDLMAAPKGYVTSPAEITVIENGPVRQAIRVVRHYNESVFDQIIRLSANGLEVENTIDWRETGSLLEAEFHPRLPLENVTYNLGFGVIERGVNTEKRYEVPAQNWAFMAQEMYETVSGLGVISDSRSGWDHPDSTTLRLTLLHTPRVNKNWRWIEDQRSMDLGIHHTGFKLVPYASTGLMTTETEGYLQPLRTFMALKSPGVLGKEVSLLHPAGGMAPHSTLGRLGYVTALKTAENSDEIIVRVLNQSDKPLKNRKLQFFTPILSAREINGQEDEIGPATVEDGTLVYDTGPWQPKAFALKLAPLQVKSDPIAGEMIALPYNMDGVSLDDDRTDGDLDGHGYTIPGELWPQELVREGIRFKLGPADKGKLNLVRCEGQTLTLPHFNPGAELVLLATSTDGVRYAGFGFKDIQVRSQAGPVAGWIGQWNSRLTGNRFVENPEEILPAWNDHLPVAWIGTHRHTPEGGNEAYTFNYFYKIRLPLPAAAGTITLPDDPAILVAAATLVHNPRQATSTLPLYDKLENVFPEFSNDALAFADQTEVMLTCRWVDASIHYTLDGSDPAPQSPLYTRPFVINSSTTVKAAAFLRGYDSPTVQASFEKLEPWPAGAVGKTTPGLGCKLYLGEWDSVPDFVKLTPVNELNVDSIALLPSAPEELFGELFEGYLRIPKTGLYTLRLTSDDGSVLYLDDSLLIDNDGLHGAASVDGIRMLEEGYHRLRVAMFQKLGGRELSVTIHGPGLKERTLAADLLFH